MTAPITRQSTMEEVLKAFPGAQRALFRRYHIGGCSSCGFQPEDTLEEVCLSRNILDVDEVIAYIQKADELDRKIQVKPQEVAEALKRREPIRLLDCRQPAEWEAARIDGAELVTQELVQEMKTSWPKDTPVIFYCHTGLRSLDAAAYFIGHGFTNVRSMAGGIEAWSQEIDPAVPRYQLHPLYGIIPASSTGGGA